MNISYIYNVDNQGVNYIFYMAELKELSGVLHPNTRKNKPNSPDFIGQILIDGQKYELAGWNTKKVNLEGKSFVNIRANRIISTHPARDPFQK